MKIIDKKGDLKNSLVGVLAFAGIVAVFVLGIFLWNYYNSSGFALGLGAEIESVMISSDGNSLLVRLKGGSVGREIESVKFVLTDVEGNKYFFETFEGLVELEVPYKSSLFGIVFGGRELEGSFDYEIFVGEIEGLGSFNGLKDISVVFNYVDEGTEKSSNILSVRVIPSGDDVTNGSVSSGSGIWSSGNTGRTGGTNVGDTNIVDGEGDGDEDEEPPIPNCIPNMQITANCLCHSEEKSSGYCCSAQWQEGGCQIFEATYYVDGNLDDDCDDYNVSIRSCGSGNKRAFNTIQKGVNVLVAGDTLAVRGGRYFEGGITIPSGTAGNLVTLKAYPGETPILDGTGVVTGWEQCTSDDPWLDGKNADYANIFRVKVDAIPALLLENSEQVFLARDPKQEKAYEEVVRNIYTPRYQPGQPITFFPVGDDAGDETDFILDDPPDTPTSKPDGFWAGATIRFFYTKINSHVVTKVISDNYDNKLFFVEPLASDKPVHVGQYRDSYAIINHPSVLDGPNQYGYTTTPDEQGKYTLYLWPDATATEGMTTQQIIDYLDDGAIRMPAKGGAFRNRQRSHYVIDGFHILGYTGSGIDAKRSTNQPNIAGVTIRNCVIEDCGMYGIFISATDNLTVENNRVFRVGQKGIDISGGTGIVVQNNYAMYAEGTQITLNGVTNARVIRNTIGPSPGVHSNGMSIYATNNRVLVAYNYFVGGSLAMHTSTDVVFYGNLFGGTCQFNMWTVGGGKQLYLHNTLNSQIHGKAGTTSTSYYYSINNMMSHYNIAESLLEVAGHNLLTFNPAASGNLYSFTAENDINARNVAFDTIINYTGEPDLTFDTVVDEIDFDHFRPCNGSPLIASGTDSMPLLIEQGVVDPENDSNSWFPGFDFTKDAAGNPWHPTNPSIGAYEYQGETNSRSIGTGHIIFEPQKRFNIIEWMRNFFSKVNP